MKTILCPTCIEITKNDVQVYNDSLKKQKTTISPIAPTCKKCDSSINTFPAMVVRSLSLMALAVAEKPQ